MSMARLLSKLLNSSGLVPASGLAPGAARANFGPGAVLQVVTGELTSFVSYNQQSFGDIGLQATITPTSATSKILVMLSFGRLQTNLNTGDYGAALRLLRNGADSDLNGASSGSRPRSMFHVGGYAFNSDHAPGGFGFSGVDNPATTSAVTYKVQAWNQNSAYLLSINGAAANTDGGNVWNGRTKSTITLMEIAA